MGIVIFWGILVILIAFILVVFLNILVDTSDTSAEGLFSLVIGILLFVICGICFIYATRKYSEKKEYSATEYRLDEKIVTVEENNVVKVDMLYSLTRKNK